MAALLASSCAIRYSHPISLFLNRTNRHVLDKIDIILLMSVNPGFGGQSFIPNTLNKLREARKMIDESGYDIRLEVCMALCAPLFSLSLSVCVF